MTGLKSRLAAIAPVGLVCLFLWAALVINPFGTLSNALDKTRGRDDQPIARTHIDARTQETTNGERPLASLRKLEEYWGDGSRAGRYILTGNSQTFTVLLAPQEPRVAGEDSTYPDLLFSGAQAKGADIRGYRLSAPNLSYVEVLWYLHYLQSRPVLKPDVWLVQLNFESFRKTGVRDGLLELLEDRAFAAAVRKEAESSRVYAAVFRQALDRHASLQGPREGGQPARVTSTGVAAAPGAANRFETRVREMLDLSAAFRSRAQVKQDFLNVLYLARVHLLGITPATKRSIGGATLELAVDSLERLGELCRQSGIRLVYFNAPQNPRAPLYRTPEDRARYQQIVQELSRQDAFHHDFEGSIPGDMWGMFVDGPDPIHFGREAHRRMAQLMLDSGLVPVRSR